MSVSDRGQALVELLLRMLRELLAHDELAFWAFASGGAVTTST